MKVKLYIISGLYFLFWINCLAQEQTDSLRLIQLDEIVITGTRTAVTRNNVPLTVSVINHKEIEESSESALLPVLSERIPGLFITERGVTGFGVASGSAGQISIRGVGGSPNTQVLVLLNGNPQYMGIFGHPIPDGYIASDIERVEVIRGPASTLYGSNAMGGVINVITKEQNEDGVKLNARILAGSYNTQKYMLNGGYKKGGFSVFAGINRDQTDGHRDSSDFTINNGFLNIGYKLNRHIKANANFSLAHLEATDPGILGEGAGEKIDILRGMGAVSVDNTFEKTEGSVRFFYNFGKHKITDGFRSHDINYGIITYQALKLIKDNTITFGVDYKNFGGRAGTTEGFVYIDTTVNELAGYVLAQQQLFSRLTLNAGFRLEHNSIYGFEPVPSGGFAFRAGPNTILKGSISKGFRSPTIRELFMWMPANDSLNPEKMVNIDAGISQSLFDNKLSFEVTIFNARGENLIQTVISGGRPKNINSGKFNNSGFEFSSTWRPLNKLMFNSNYSYIHMDEPVLATPEHKIYFSGTLSIQTIVMNLALQHISGLYMLTGENELKESYTLVNARIGYTLNKYVDVFLKGENLLNKEYQINYGYPMPKFTGFGGINLHF